MNILVYENRKIDPVMINASDEDKAFLYLFNYLKNDWDVYCELDEPIPWDVDTDKMDLQRKLYSEACQGNAKSAHRLLKLRRNYEYEAWFSTTLIEP